MIHNYRESPEDSWSADDGPGPEGCSPFTAGSRRDRRYRWQGPLVGKIALVISAIIGLKKLLSSSGKHVTYEVVSHPHHSNSHVVSHDEGHGGGGGYGGGGADYGGGGGGYSGGSGHGWARSLPQDAHELAYRAHQPQQQA